jgi:hypothetical protein
MKSNRNALFALALACLIIGGCAKATVQPKHQAKAPVRLARPEVVLVYDLAADPAVVSLDSAIGKRVGRGMQQAELAEERKALGARVADAFSDQLVLAIRERGIIAKRAAEPPPGSPVPGLRQNAIMVKGRFLEINEGNRTRRMAIGFGAGATEVKTEVKLYQAKDPWPMLLQEYETNAVGSRKPGMALPVGVGAAAGTAATSAAISGGLGVIGEMRGGVEGDAQRSAVEVSRAIATFFAKRGWISAEMAK